MAWFWTNVLVAPLFNALIWLYEHSAFGNLGVAVIELTVILRFVLLPLTVVGEREEMEYEKLEKEVESIIKQFKGDTVAAHEQVRALLKERRINPWAKSAVLLVQLVVLFVLYRVFISGIQARLDLLYPWVVAPELPINVSFFGFDIGVRNFWWAFSVGAFLYVEIVVEQRKIEHLLGPRDAVFRYAFPIFSVVILWLLPMVKTIFILTSMLFSTFVTLIRSLLWPTGSTN